MSAQRFDPIRFSPMPGITLIEASAGTGKTYSITQIVCQLIAEGRCRIDEILVLTFTETATQELRDRIRKALADAITHQTALANERALTALSQALDSFESASIFTIHGFCNRILREFSLEAGLGTEFAILKNSRHFDEKLEVEVARDIQSIAAENPMIFIGMQALELKPVFIRQTLALKEATDLTALQNQNNGHLKDWFSDLFPNLRSHWQQDRTLIRRLLLADSPPIKRTRTVYKTEGLTALMDRLDAVFSGGNAHLSFLQDLHALAYSTLRDDNVLRKNQTLPALDFFLTCDRISDAMQKLLELLIRRILEIREQQIEKLVFQEQTLRFDELLSFTKRLICDADSTLAARLFEKFKVGMIDEFQDTDPVQFKILEHIFLKPPAGEDPRPLVLIGDPKQAIYGFRGGDIFTYNRAKQGAHSTYFLDTNWRSCPAVNAAVNQLLTNNSRPFHFDWISYQSVLTAEKNQSKRLLISPELASGPEGYIRSGIEWIALEPESQDFHTIESVASDIAGLLHARPWLQFGDTSRKLKPSDIGVLVPDNRNGARIHEALGKRQVASTIFGGASVFQTPEAQQLYATLNALLNPRDVALVRGAIAGTCFNPVLIVDAAADENAKQHRWIETLRSFSTASHLWKTKGLGLAFTFLEKQFQWKENLSLAGDPNRTLANHQHLTNLLLEQEGGETRDCHALLRWFREHIEEPDKKDQDQLLQLDTDADTVTIMTMHKSKGLEFPVVFLPFLPKSRGRSVSYPNQYHDPTTGDLRTNLSKHLVSAQIQNDMEAETRSEALRTLYVAITRAEVICRIYLSPDDHSDRVIHAWLPEGETLTDRIDTFQSRLQSAMYPLTPSDVPPPPPPEVEIAPLLTPNNPPTAPLPPGPIAHLSFTGIVLNSTEKDEVLTDEPVLFTSPVLLREHQDNKEGVSMFDFDRGTNAGLMFHELLQFTQFDEPKQWQNLIHEKLQQFGYAPKPWLAVLKPWLEVLSTAPIKFPKGGTLIFRKLNKKTIFRETEFSYTTSWSRDTWERIKQLFATSSWVKNLEYQLPDVAIARDALQSFVNGVVDFWCIHEDRIYLVDWKSNHLGHCASHYSEDAIRQNMHEHHYHLQYLLYICAINRYLSAIDPHYRYQDHFAGVGYCYLRGIDPEVPNSGWFTTLPPSDFIDALGEILAPKQGGNLA